MIRNFQDLMQVAKEQKTMRLAVAAAQDEDVLVAVLEAAQQGLVEPVLVGDLAQVKAIAEEKNMSLEGCQMIEAIDLTEAARVTVALVKEGKADFVMKGLIDTAILLKAVLDKEIGLRTDSQLSHVMVYDAKAYHKLLYLTDGGMNITPDLDAKKMIVANAIDVVKAMGVETVKVACLAAKEKVNPKMPATVDADALQKMSEAGDFGTGVVVEGPLAFDLAVSEEAAKIKGFTSDVAGDADVLMVPNIEMGNGIGKSMTYIGQADSAGIIMGAKVPVVLTSRADSAQVKLNSIAMGSVIAAYKK